MSSEHRAKARAALRAALRALVAVGCAVGSCGAQQVGVACQNVVVPAYFYPAAPFADWTKAVREPKLRVGGRRLLIVNPANGPGVAGAAYVAGYKREIAMAHAAGVTVLGYVRTDYADAHHHASLAKAEADVEAYKTLGYGVDGVFFDETASASKWIAPYYAPLVEYVQRGSPGAVVMLNVGTWPDEAYMKFGGDSVIVSVFDDPYANYLATAAPDWVRKYPAGRFANLVYAVPDAGAFEKAMVHSRELNAGWVYVTDGDDSRAYARAHGSEVWGGLSRFWGELNARAAVGCE